MKRFIFVLSLVASFLSYPAQAQSTAPYIVHTTKPISDELRANLNAWLADSPPSDAPYYIVTYSKEKPLYTIVSLIGVDLDAPGENWNLSEGSAVWMGTVFVLQDGSVSLTKPVIASEASGGDKPLFAPGWQGSYTICDAGSPPDTGDCSFTGTAWNTYTDGSHTLGLHNDNVRQWNGVGGYIDFTYTGTYFALYGLKYTNRGDCKLSVDGSFYSNVSEYGAEEYNVKLIEATLSYGTHTIRYEVLDSAHICDLDYYEVDLSDPASTPTNTPTFTPTPTLTFTPTETFTPTLTPTPTLTYTPTATPTYTPSPTITPGPSPTVSVTPSNTPPPAPTMEPPPGGGSTVGGGGSYVAFPWQLGTSAVYGPRAVHGEGDYGTSGMVAVDFVSGTNLGPSAAGDGVYASAPGTIDYVCEDATTTAVRTHDPAKGDYFVYAHMLANDNLDYGTSFTKGQLIGNLRHGAFRDTCGWAEQSDQQWHVHWMFVPANGSFRAEDCRLTISTQKWDCNGQILGTGQAIYGGGGAGSTGASGLGTASGGIADTQKTFWDYFLGGIIHILDILFFQQLPEHGSSQIIYAFYNAIDVVFRLARVLVFQNINIYPLVAAIGYAIILNLLFAVAWVASFLLKAWKSLVPLLGA